MRISQSLSAQPEIPQIGTPFTDWNINIKTDHNEACIIDTAKIDALITQIVYQRYKPTADEITIIEATK